MKSAATIHMKRDYQIETLSPSEWYWLRVFYYVCFLSVGV